MIVIHSTGIMINLDHILYMAEDGARIHLYTVQMMEDRINDPLPLVLEFQDEQTGRDAFQAINDALIIGRSVCHLDYGDEEE